MRRTLLITLIGLGFGCDVDRSGGQVVPQSADDTFADEPFDTGGRTSAPSADDDPLDPEGCDALPPAVVLGDVSLDPAATVPTCTAVGDVDWKLRTKWTYSASSFAMNVVVAPRAGASTSSVFLDAGEKIEVVNGRSGSVEYLVDIGYLGQDGCTPAVGDLDHDGDLELVTPRAGSVLVLDVEAGMVRAFANTGDAFDIETVLLADVDRVGAHEILLNRASFDFDGAEITRFDGGTQPTGQFVADLDQDGLPEVVGENGILSPLDGSGVSWVADEGLRFEFYGGPVSDDEGGADVVYVNDQGGLRRARRDGSVVWNTTYGGEGWLSSIADATGDGVADICVAQDDRTLLLMDIDGNVHHSWTFAQYELWSGGCTMADLDADGVYEVLLLSRYGFRILDGTTGGVRAEDLALGTTARDSAPVVADVDGDGSAEILVLQHSDAEGSLLTVLGPKTGRWARTRPVWNQLAYDITSVRDDGSLVSQPLPVWDAYNAFRAQPSHDGERPDLALSIDRVDATRCVTTVLFTVQNAGSVDASAGTEIQLHGVAQGAWGVLASTTLADPLPVGHMVQGHVSADVSSLTGPIQLTALPAHIDECDMVNNRAEITID